MYPYVKWEVSKFQPFLSFSVCPKEELILEVEEV